jgi:hypothetical protein
MKKINWTKIIDNAFLIFIMVYFFLQFFVIYKLGTILKNISNKTENNFSQVLKDKKG